MLKTSPVVKPGPQKVLLSVRWLSGRSLGQRKGEPAWTPASINLTWPSGRKRFRPPGRGHAFFDGFVRDVLSPSEMALAPAPNLMAMDCNAFPVWEAKFRLALWKPTDSEGLCSVPVQPLSYHQYSMYNVPSTIIMIIKHNVCFIPKAE